MIQQPLDIAEDYYYHRYLHPEMPVSCVPTTTAVIFDKKIDLIRMNRAAICQFFKNSICGNNTQTVVNG